MPSQETINPAAGVRAFPDERCVCVEFIETATGVTVRQTFDADSTSTVDEQRQDWQSVLDSFARHVAAIREH
jgi:hypothetical protein